MLLLPTIAQEAGVLRLGYGEGSGASEALIYADWADGAGEWVHLKFGYI